ncbi:MAG: hypothetical protein ACPHP8_09910 [Luminiphilus sp.]
MADSMAQHVMGLQDDVSAVQDSAFVLPPDEAQDSQQNASNAHYQQLPEASLDVRGAAQADLLPEQALPE